MVVMIDSSIVLYTSAAFISSSSLFEWGSLDVSRSDLTCVFKRFLDGISSI